MSRRTLYRAIVFVSSTTCATCTVRASAFGLLENWKQRTRSVADIATIDSGHRGRTNTRSGGGVDSAERGERERTARSGAPSGMEGRSSSFALCLPGSGGARPVAAFPKIRCLPSHGLAVQLHAGLEVTDRPLRLRAGLARHRSARVLWPSCSG